ncbi:uncharacterized protein LOC129570596 [Sitodiplosis mosellana]|uniref:uncharacterized protein LOC129570596 n=1 Tax=Sitodiplosis mosellana TaxID=263140 RepID=UPI002444F227|nr:uncharacterized protein LOC129570596 [Sitodiplosis mosellana]
METIKYVIFSLCFISCDLVGIVYGNCEKYIFGPHYFCNDMLLSEVTEQLEQIFPKAQNSNKTLRLEHIGTRDGILRKNWINSNYAIFYLMMKDIDINEIEDGAFVAEAFAMLEKLDISCISLRCLNSSTFDGLSKLSHLRFENVQIKKLHENILVPVPNLETFIMLFFRSDPLNLDNFFGLSNKLPKLHMVSIWRCNLSETITERTFTGLEGIKTLKLEENEIQRIGARSFNVPLKTLTYIGLRGNEMTSIPNNLFNVDVENTVMVNLDQNPWHCDCRMEHFRQFMQSQSRVQFNSPRCETPSEYKGHLISKLPNLCRKSTVQLHDDNKIDKSITLWCKTSKSTESMENVILKPPSPAILLLRSIGRKLFIDYKKPSNNFKLFGYEQASDSNKNALNCFTNAKTNANIQMATNQMYRFCWIKNGSKTISLLNCASFVANSIQNLDAWIMMEYKAIYVIVWILSAIFVVVIGILIGLSLTKLYFIVFSEQNIGAGMEETAKEIPEYATINKTTKSPPNVYKHFGGIEELGNSFIDYEAPPLPPRNKKVSFAKYKCCNSEICECYCEL